MEVLCCVIKHNVICKPELIYLLIFLMVNAFAGKVFPKLNSQFVSDNLTSVAYLLLFAVAILLFYSQLVDGVTKVNAKGFVLLLLIGFVTFFAEVFAGIFVYVIGIENMNEKDIVEVTQSGNVLLWSVVVVLIAPVVEEFAYRFCVASIFPRHQILAGVVSVFLFSFVHVAEYIIFDKDYSQLIAMLPYVALGTGLYVLYAKTNNIVYPILLHSTINLIAITS